MAFVKPYEMLKDAQDYHYAICAFNVENMEMMQGVVEAAEAMHKPIILQVSPKTVSYIGLRLCVASVKALATAASIPIALHLDHGDSFALCKEAGDAGFTSVMIDGSGLSFDKNVHITQQVVRCCKPLGIPVEAELGHVGGKGEDDCGVYTDPLQAKIFVAETQITTLAVAIGTVHGVYTGTPHIDLDVLSRIRDAVSIPLVLHGSSGLGEDLMKACIKRGITKVNYATDLRIAFTKGVKEAIQNNPSNYDPKVYNELGKTYVKECAERLIALCSFQ